MCQMSSWNFVKWQWCPWKFEEISNALDFTFSRQIVLRCAISIRLYLPTKRLLVCPQLWSCLELSQLDFNPKIQFSQTLDWTYVFLGYGHLKIMKIWSLKQHLGIDFIYSEDSALNKQSVNNRSVNWEIVIYM